ncbi:MAG TPA: Na+/H+ antiporter subunit E [Trebonia sp.]|jgi:multisubunit Na+/H+ antiporter MnhE subunit|nr:Na+/H+ antiporter subunit E [Trebonia sp.]
MGFWMALDDSLRPDELVTGALASVLAALLATVVSSQAGEPVRARLSWLRGRPLRRALALPGDVARDTLVIYAALARLLARGTVPGGGYVLVPLRYGGSAPPDATRRVLVTWTTSLAPDTLAVAFDPARDVQVVHRLTGDRPQPGDAGPGGPVAGGSEPGDW